LHIKILNIMLASDLKWLEMSNGDKVNIKIILLDGIYNFTVNNFCI
jgi:hypothetical protein